MRIFLRLLAGLAVVLLVLALVRHFTAERVPAKPTTASAASSVGSAPSAAIDISSEVVRQEVWQPFLESVGSVTAIKGVNLSTEIAGIVRKIAFESGVRVKAGDLLVQLDITQEQAQLAQATAKRDLDKINLDRYQNLLTRHTVAQADFDSAEANFRTAQGAVDEQNAIIGKKTIRAPFDGVVGIRQINLGQYLGAGQAIVTLQAFDPIYVNFQLPQENLSSFSAGSKVEVRVDAHSERTFNGKITAVDAQVDANSRNVQVQATLPNSDYQLRPGMYARISIATGQVRDVTTVPVAAVNFAPYGNSVFVVSEIPDAAGRHFQGVKQQFVRLGETRGDRVAVLTGLKPGERVATSAVFRLRSGEAVRFGQNEKSPGPEHTPAKG